MVQVSQIIFQPESDKMLTNHDFLSQSAKTWEMLDMDTKYRQHGGLLSGSSSSLELVEERVCPGFRAAVIYMPFIFKPHILQGETLHLKMQFNNSETRKGPALFKT